MIPTFEYVDDLADTSCQTEGHSGRNDVGMERYWRPDEIAILRNKEAESLKCAEEKMPHEKLK